MGRLPRNDRLSAKFLTWLRDQSGLRSVEKSQFVGASVDGALFLAFNYMWAQIDHLPEHFANERVKETNIRILHDRHLGMPVHLRAHHRATRFRSAR